MSVYDCITARNFRDGPEAAIYDCSHAATQPFSVGDTIANLIAHLKFVYS